jgi:hypothetical protein
MAAVSVISSSSSEGSIRAGHQLVEAREQAAAAELARRQVDRQPQPAQPLVLPFRQQGHGAPSTQSPSGRIRPFPRRSG